MSLDEALDAVSAHATPEWKTEARKIVQWLCETNAEFTADQFWPEIEKTPWRTHDNRAFGSIMRAAVKEGWCTKTSTFVKTTRKNCHASDIPIYASLLFRSQS